MATDQFSRYGFADLEQCMKTLISFLESIRASYESRLEPRAYAFEITEIIKCIKKNEIYWRRGKALGDVIKDAKKVASFWTNISCSNEAKEQQTTMVIKRLFHLVVRSNRSTGRAGPIRLAPAGLPQPAWHYHHCFRCCRPPLAHPQYYRSTTIHLP